MIHILGESQRPGTGSSLVPGGIFVAFNFNEFPIFYIELLTAGTVTAGACRPDCGWKNFYGFVIGHYLSPYVEN
jgi:hypothetical protein